MIRRIEPAQDGRGIVSRVAVTAGEGRRRGRVSTVTGTEGRERDDQDRPRRLEEKGAEELRGLAISFNQTLDALERSIQAQRHLIQL